MHRLPRPSLVGVAVATAAVLGLGSLLVARSLGYDAYAWMVWARELMHGTLSTAGGPALKPLPMILAAPFTPFADLAPITWLAAMRVAALLSLFVAYRLGTRLAGWPAGLTAAALIAAEPDVYRTAMYGSSEPLLVLLVLLAAERWVDGRPAPALALLGVAGLMRPELWPVVGTGALLMAAHDGRARTVPFVAAIAPPVIWLALDWAGSGKALHTVAGHSNNAVCVSCAAMLVVPHAIIKAHTNPDAVDVLRRVAQSIALPALALAGVALAVPRRSTDRRRLVVIAIVAVAWIAIVAVMAQVGYPGSRRYLAGPAALLAVLAGVGAVIAIQSVTAPRGQWAIGLLLAVVIIAVDAHTIVSDGRLVSTARAIQRTQADLKRAISRAGGNHAVLEQGRPAVNPWAQTVLAWDLSAPLNRTQPTWRVKPLHPGWQPPALVFRGPSRLVGPAPGLGPRRPAKLVLRVHGWEVLRALTTG